MSFFFFSGVTTKQKAVMVVGGVILIVFASMVMAPDLWKAIGVLLPSFLGANTVFRWIIGGFFFVLGGCFLLLALFIPRRNIPKP